MEEGGKVNADFCLEQSGEWWLLFLRRSPGQLDNEYYMSTSGQVDSEVGRYSNVR